MHELLNNKTALHHMLESVKKGKKNILNLSFFVVEILNLRISRLLRVYPESCQASKMNLFVNIAKGKPLAIFTKSSIVDVQSDFE